MTETRNIERYVLYNFQSDETRIRKTKPPKSDLSPYTATIEIDLDIELPETDIPTVSETLELPESRVREAVAELGMDEAATASEYPDPARVLTMNDADDIEESLEDLGIDSIADGERESALSWLRTLFVEEQQRHGRDDVLDLLTRYMNELGSEGSR